MKTIGLLGGMSWESTAHYYRLLNEGVKARLGGLHSAHVLLESLDFAPIAALQSADRWDEAGQLLAAGASRLEAAGADVIALCTNTMHLCCEAIEAAITVPFVHIADPTAAAVHAAGIDRVALLGTAFTMERDFYRARLEATGLTVLTPAQAGRDQVHRIIYDELILGTVKAESRVAYQKIVTGLALDGAAGVILGCTEIGMLIGPQDVALPLFDTTALHAEALLDFALADTPTGA